ncbi:CorA family divalent cation transporter [Streptomyces sp. NPDC059918]|uniref:magnesium transporter CorA family protein n=1 Tax=unclassified Streptomyces TaxID=2593676 RepID=UPI003652FA47
MIVSLVAMPEGVVARTALSDVRERLAAPEFVIVDMDRGEDAPSDEPDEPDEQPLARLLGLDDKTWEWLGRRGEPVRADYRAGTVGCVVPVVDGSHIKHIHVFASERHLVTIHHGPVELVDTFIGRLPEDRPSNGAMAVFLFLHGVLEVFRRATAQALLEVGEVEEAMSEGRASQHVHRLAQLRRRAAQLHRAFLPYAAIAQEFLTHRRMADPGLSEERQAMNRMHERTVQLVMMEIDSLRDETRRAADTYASLVAEQQNLVINKLAIASVIFLPLSFLTGFFGMNFSYLSNNLASEQTFLWLGIGMQVCALVVAMYVVLYRTHWRQLRGGRSDDATDGRLPDPS